MKPLSNEERATRRSQMTEMRKTMSLKQIAAIYGITRQAVFHFIGPVETQYRRPSTIIPMVPGTVIGAWVVQYDPGYGAKVSAQCECGRVQDVNRINLRKGLSKRCFLCAPRRRSTVKLSPASVSEIRKLLQKGVSQREIAKKYGVSAPHISDIAHQKSWKNVK